MVAPMNWLLSGERIKYFIGAAIGTWLAAEIIAGYIGGADGVAAIATLVAAGAAVAIPIVLQRAAQREATATKARAERIAEVSAMRELVSQWQDYNLAVATGAVRPEHIRDHHIAHLDEDRIRKLYLIFFELTALHQLHFSIDDTMTFKDWARTMIADIGDLCKQDEELFKIATVDRGYTQAFLDYLRSAGAQRYDCEDAQPAASETCSSSV
jgi:hypothetical protein